MNHINLTKFAFVPRKFFVGKAKKLFYWRNRHVDVFQITVDFVFVYYNKAVYEHEKTANMQLIDVTGSFQLSLHAANTNSQKTVFTINIPPSFLLWWI